MSELFLEIRSEEIPARMQVRAGEDLRKAMVKELEAAGLSVDDVTVLTGPRRLVFAASVPARSPDTREERKGPRVGSPEQALAGFMKAAGLSDISEAELRTDPKKGEFYVAVMEREGRDTSAIAAEIIPAVMGSFPWPKSMRSGASDFRWVRPLRGVVALLDGEVIPFNVGGISAGKSTEGHRQHGPGPYVVTGLDDYREQLEGPGHVILDHAKRCELIREQSLGLCQGAEDGFSWVEDEGLLNEVAGLVEWPVILLGDMDPAFLKLPEEVIRLTLKSHQKTFVVRRKDGTLAPHFVIVANLDAPDGGKTIKAGNAKVINARLSDAQFFMAEDAKMTLANHGQDLSRVVFHDELGSFANKVERVAALAREIAPHVGADAGKAEQAARLSKNDLVTQTVIEMTSLQGQIGRMMAERDGVDADVALAIEEHYKPQGPSDAVPTSPVSVAVALADKLDSLVAFWEIEEKPTGSKDPYALRRAALGVVRIILENSLNIQLQEIVVPSMGRLLPMISNVRLKKVLQSLKTSYDNQAVSSEEALQISSNRINEFLGTKSSDEEVAIFQKAVDNFLDLESFIFDRLRGILRDQGHRHDVIDAVIADGGDDLLAISQRVEALGEMLGTDDGENVVQGYKRAANILRAERKKGELSLSTFDSLSGFTAKPAEALHHALTSVRPQITDALSANDYPAALSGLAGLRVPIDAFFADVIVNSDEADERLRRLSLLDGVVETAHQIADFSKLDG